MSRALAARRPVRIEMLSARPPEHLLRHDGVTSLDREIMSDHSVSLERGFGADVDKAIRQGQQWLVEQDLGSGQGDDFVPARNLLAKLQRRELTAAGAQLRQESGLDYVEARSGEHVNGVFRRAVQTGETKFALVERARFHARALAVGAGEADRQIGRRDHARGREYQLEAGARSRAGDRLRIE